MRYLFSTAAFAVLSLFCGGTASAVFTDNLTLGGGGGLTGAGSPLSVSGSDGGVNFTANFTLTGTADRVAPGINFDAPSETFTITFDNFTAVTGGTATFNGFNSLTLLDVDDGNEGALVSTGDLFTIDGVNALTGAPSNGGIGGAITVTAAGASPEFLLSTLEIQVTGGAGGAAGVPEPSAFALMAFAGAGVAVRRRRRK